MVIGDNLVTTSHDASQVDMDNLEIWFAPPDRFCFFLFRSDQMEQKFSSHSKEIGKKYLLFPSLVSMFSWLFNRCYVMSGVCERVMGTWWSMTGHHDHDRAITTGILPTQHLWWSTKILGLYRQLVLLIQCFKFMNIWCVSTEQRHSGSKVIFLWLWCACAPGEWGWVIESYHGSSRLVCSTAAH